ncbi:MAG TPA: DVUA0089 family protein [Planctomycetota bacterium]|nr:DVUA0089 family protein [Planctomycetota bacterium]
MQAASWNENSDGGGDAGQSLPTAQKPVGSGKLSSISGVLSNRNDVDLYKIHITDPENFSASTLGGGNFDTQLFLFTSNGFGVMANDDYNNTLQSFLPGSCLLPVGCYFLAISTYDNDPENAWNLRMFPNFLPTFVVPAWPWGGTLDHWSDEGSTCGCQGPKNYTISLTGAGFCEPALPEPATLALLGLGLGMIGVTRRRKLA